MYHPLRTLQCMYMLVQEMEGTMESSVVALLGSALLGRTLYNALLSTLKKWVAIYLGMFV